ncbi:ClbS/DfsB family four-helix bundle protein [Cellulosimicrobium cellulans]|uniref:ClbS/DfsB family four-helix bundle protein n=1 Tax=Cellulosimicrobium cellulans TaxID=1710 RepID=UPI0019634EE8|nr:ClbS/DfsB family four-helix bundle protein [Cellulosimicrobium cellulans]MBN0038920.1 ClbS/DfsB family four-helix bundle protein [Cellulosimicrobium cellulans]
MPVPRSKPELLSAIGSEYDALVRDLERVPPDRVRETSMPAHRAGAVMSPADLVAYLVGWNELVVSWHAQRARGEEPELPSPGYRWNQLGSLAERFYADCADVPWPALLARLDVARAEIVALVSDASDEELYGAPWYGKHTAGRMIQLNTSSAYANARRRLRAWLRTFPDGPTSPT